MQFLLRGCTVWCSKKALPWNVGAWRACQSCTSSPTLYQSSQVSPAAFESVASVSGPSDVTVGGTATTASATAFSTAAEEELEFVCSSAGTKRSPRALLTSSSPGRLVPPLAPLAPPLAFQSLVPLPAPLISDARPVSPASRGARLVPPMQPQLSSHPLRPPLASGCGASLRETCLSLAARLTRRRMTCSCCCCCS